METNHPANAGELDATLYCVEKTDSNSASRVGKAIITTAGNEDDGGNYQLNGESFETTSYQDLYFGTKLKIGSITRI